MPNLLGTIYAYGMFKNSRKWALNTSPQTTTILRKRLKKKGLLHYGYYFRKALFENILLGIKVYENIFFWKPLFESFSFCIKNKIFKKNIFWKHFRKKKKNFEFFFSLVFGSFGPPLKKGKMNYFLGKKVLDPHFFRKQIFFYLKRFWKQFPYNFWKQILFHAENNFC